MADEVQSIMDLLRSDKDLHARAMELALQSKDESLSVLDRMAALVQLGVLVRFAGYTTEDLNAPKKPEYRWVNGAKVRVR